jgi:predicted PurR-regulated permease PerM
MSLRSIRNRRDELAAANGSALETMIVVTAVVTALYLGRTIAIPIAIAVLISFTLGPLVTWLRRRHLGRLPSILIAISPVILGWAAFAYVVTTEVGRLAENIPAYQANIESKVSRAKESLPSPEMLQRGSDFLKNLTRSTSDGNSALSNDSRSNNSRPNNSQAPKPRSGESKPIPVQIESPDPGPMDMLRSVLGPLIDPLSGVGLVLLFVFFFLAEQEALRDRVIRLAGTRDIHRTTMAMDEAGSRVSRFLLLQSGVNVVFGLTITLGLYILGLPNAALWGGMVAVLRFIPYFGVIAATILPLALAFAVDPGWTMLFWTGGLFLALEMTVGNIVEPWLYGSSTGLSALALVVSAIFWTWLWGTIGLLLATPLTVCIAVVGRYVPQLAFLDILLGNQPPLKPEESFYQRLLAGDPDEATRQAEDFLKTKSLIEFYGHVALPALILAERDRLRGELDSEHVKQLANGIKTVADNLAPENAKPEKQAAQDDNADEAQIDSNDIILCVAGRSDLDEAAALLLARLLEGDERTVVTLAYNSAINISLPGLDESRIKTVCLSYLDAEAIPHARYLARRFRRRLGTDVCIVAGFWSMGQNAAQIEHAKTETRADRLVVSFPTAVETIGRTVKNQRYSGTEPDTDLEELAKRISEAMSRIA